MDPNARNQRTSPLESRVPGIDVYEVVFRKGEHEWRFRYVAGDESAMIEAVRDVMRQGRGLDWVDLALIAHEIRSGVSIEVVRKKEGIL